MVLSPSNISVQLASRMYQVVIKIGVESIMNITVLLIALLISGAAVAVVKALSDKKEAETPHSCSGSLGLAVKL